jgi:glycerol kinase
MGSTHESFVGSIDQGTTSTRFLIFNRSGEPVASHQIEFKQIYPQPGYVSITSRAESDNLLTGFLAGMNTILSRSSPRSRNALMGQ